MNIKIFGPDESILTLIPKEDPVHIGRIIDEIPSELIEYKSEIDIPLTIKTLNIEYNLNALSVMIIDDDIDFLKLAHRELLNLGHYVEAYSNPSIAHTEIRKNPRKYNKIIIDQKMPEISGDHLAEMIRNTNNYVDICILTASSLEDVSPSFSANFQAIKKPCKMIYLVGSASDEHAKLTKKAA